jgi:hypothetical protein
MNLANYLRLKVSTLMVYLLESAVRKDIVPDQDLPEVNFQIVLWRMRKRAAQVRQSNG